MHTFRHLQHTGRLDRDRDRHERYGTIFGSSSAIGPIDHFAISTDGPALKTAGTPFTATVDAQDSANHVLFDYAGSPTLSGLGSSPACPLCSPAIAAASPDYGAPLSFTNGEATASVTPKQAIINAGTGATLTVSDGTHNGSTSFDVQNAAAPGGFTISTTGGSTKTAGTGFTANLGAFDAYGNVNTTYTTGASLSGLGNSPGCAACSPVISPATPTYGGTLTFANGTASPTVTAKQAVGTGAFNGATLTVTNGGVSNSTQFDVQNAAAPGGFTISTTGGPTKTAGGAFTANLGVVDAYGNVNKTYTTGASLSGLGSSPGCAACSPVIPVANPTYGGTLSFANGTASPTVTAKKAIGTGAFNGATLTVSNGTVSNSTQFDVQNATALAGFTISTTGGSTKTAGTGFTANLGAFDAYGNVNKTYTTGASLSGLGSSPGCAACSPVIPVATPTYGGTLTFANGTASPTVTAKKAIGTGAFNGATLTLTDGSISNSTSFDVDPGPLATS